MTGAWVWAGGRAIGTAHLGQGLPCQDAFACKIWQRADASPVLIAALADGAGSAERAEIGSALATALFVDIVHEGFTASPALPDAAHLLRYAVGEARRAIELKAGHDDRAINDYATTLLMVILSREAAVVGQIGDGAVVVPDAECGWRPVHWPDHGEYANTTRFLTEADALDALQIATLAPAPRRVCLFSDGLERLVLDFRNRSAHAPFFDSICSRFDGRADAGHAADVSHDLETLLTSDKVNSRTDDDKSLLRCLAWRLMMGAAAVRQAPQTMTVGAGAITGTRSGVAYKLGQEIGAGGNGVVYTIARRPELVAKISKHALGRHDVDKLDALVHGATPDLLNVAAWPFDCLKSSTGHVIGFIMPRILHARPLYELYSPRSRVQHFPSADFRFLVHTATNVARLFAAVHKAGFIAGDVNHSNILVRHNGTVAAVDCDSFQVGDGARFPCLVGTELFVPPELMGASLGATRRTANHDNFGLAVLIFHLLFMGRHPFAGRFLGKGDMPIERAIAESRFAYSRDVKRTQISPPPYTPPMDAVGPGVIELFERAFHPDGRTGARPSPESWIDALEALKASLSPCKDVPWHHHVPKAKACPWCAIEVPSRIKLFGGIIKVATAAIADLETLWAHYLSTADPGPPRALPKPAAWKAPPATKRDWRSIIARVHGDRLFWLAALVYFGAKFYWDELTALAPRIGPAIVSTMEKVAAAAPAAEVLVLAGLGVLCAGPLVVRLLGLSMRGLARLFVKPAPATQTQTSKRVRRHEAELAWRKAAAAWREQPLPPDVSHLRQQIEALKPDLDALIAEREARIKACAAPAPEAEQRARFLGQFRIEDAKLNNIGPARCAVLRSWGIDTAADVDDAKIAEIPGFGKNLTDKLVLWRERQEKAFAYNSAPIIDPLEVQRIDRQLAARRTKLMKELREKIVEVERRMSGYMKERAALWAQVETAHEGRMTV